MNYRFIERIEIKNGNVYIRSLCSGTSPPLSPDLSHYCLCEDHALTNLLQTEGVRAVYKEIGKGLFEGNIIMRPHNCLLAEYLKRAGDLLKVPLKFSLDADHAGEFVAVVTEGYENNPFYSPIQDLEKLSVLRLDPEAVFSICQNNPAAFHFSDESVRRDRELARRYIQEFICSDGFSFPTYFRDDKALAVEALKKNASVFRQLDPCLRNDKDIVRIAYCPTTPRKEPDLFASYIGKSLRSNATFMRELVRKCPYLKLDDCMDILSLPGVAETWALHNVWLRKDIMYVPSDVLIKPTVRNTLISRFAGDSSFSLILDKLIDHALYTDAKPLADHCLSSNLPSRRSAKTHNN